MEERREFVRLDTRLPIQYWVVPSAQAIASVTTDLGGGGMCLFVNEPLKPGTRLQVAIRLPELQRSVTFTCEVIWCEQYEMIGKSQRTRSVEAGVKFLQIDAEDREAIMHHVILSLQPPSP